VVEDASGAIAACGVSPASVEAGCVNVGAAGVYLRSSAFVSTDRAHDT
jgi:hypothetical protein